MTQQSQHINKWLLPLSWLYGIVVFIRNRCFKLGILKQEKYDIPIICVGNITVGGTGKTPHTEYLVSLLKEQFRVAVLSRGYKRKTKGFVLAAETSTSKEIGDEPLQIKLKYPHIIVAVDTNRRRGIEKLLALPKENRPQVILLDDAYQHRHVIPSFSILLTNYNRPMYDDRLLPAGRLREPAYYAEQANIIITTKCPQTIKPIKQRIIHHELKPYAYQSLFFTTFKYGKLTSVFSQEERIEISQIKKQNALLILGIANPDDVIKEIRTYTKEITSLAYPDHYNFKKGDVRDIESKFKELNNPIVITTEKDAARLRELNLSEELKNNLYYLPIEVSFVGDDAQEKFDTQILEHVRENTKNSRFS